MPNVAQQILINYFQANHAQSGTSEVARDSLLFLTLAAYLDDAPGSTRPMTDAIAELEALSPGAGAIRELRTRHAAILNSEAKR